MRRLILLSLLLAAPAFAEADTFFGWSKDGSWYAYQTVSGPNDLTELFFCASEENLKPSWPTDLNGIERDDTQKACVRYTDPNRAPYGWKAALVLPKPSLKSTGQQVSPELVVDGESPGYVVLQGEKRVTCYVSGLRERSKLGNVFWHPNGRYVGAFIDNGFHHCDQPLKAGPPPKPSPPPKPKPPPAPKGKKKK
jgi:hypothetical protein